MVLIYVIFLLFSSYSYANSCRSLLSDSTQSTDFSSFLTPLKIENLVQNVDLGAEPRIHTLDPSIDIIVWTNQNKKLFTDIGFPIESFDFRDRNRIVETDFGYAVLDVDELRDWSLLKYTISDLKRTQAFINQVANTPGLFPKGITKEAAEWLRGSAITEYESTDEIEYQRFIREKEFFMFPFKKYAKEESNQEFNQESNEESNQEFNQESNEESNQEFNQESNEESNIIADDEAQFVLEFLTRHFLISNLYVKRPDGSYAKLAEFLDRDSLMLLSRFPELMPAAPVFEGGHFNVEDMKTIFDGDDLYNLVERYFPTVSVSGHALSNLFIAIVEDGEHFLDEEEESNLELDRLFFAELEGFFAVSFEDEVKAMKELSANTIEEAFSREVEKIDEFLALKTDQFKEFTGYNLPVSTVIYDEQVTAMERYYYISFGEVKIPIHILTAFYVFAGLY